MVEQPHTYPLCLLIEPSADRGEMLDLG